MRFVASVTSPVSSSTTSSITSLVMFSANLCPTNFLLKSALDPNFTASDKPKRFNKSSSVEYPKERSRVVAGIFFLRSIYAHITSRISVVNSIQEPLKGITRAEYSWVPFGCIDCPKNTPGERCN